VTLVLEAVRRTQLPVALLFRASDQNPVYWLFSLGTPSMRTLAQFLDIGYAPVGYRGLHRCRRFGHVAPALCQGDVLGAGAFLTPAFGVGHFLSFAKFIETDALEAR
jgi:hypothetical protein